MTLDSRRITVQVTDADGANHVFTDAVAVQTVSQDVSTELGYLAYRDFALGHTCAPQEVQDEIQDLLAQGTLIHG